MALLLPQRAFVSSITRSLHVPAAACRGLRYRIIRLFDFSSAPFYSLYERAISRRYPSLFSPIVVCFFEGDFGEVIISRQPAEGQGRERKALNAKSSEETYRKYYTSVKITAQYRGSATAWYFNRTSSRCPAAREWMRNPAGKCRGHEEHDVSCQFMALFAPTVALAVGFVRTINQASSNRRKR